MPDMRVVSLRVEIFWGLTCVLLLTRLKLKLLDTYDHCNASPSWS